MRYTFSINKFERIGETHNYKVLTFEAEGDTLEEAYKTIEQQIPEGHRVWACWSNERVPDDQ